MKTPAMLAIASLALFSACFDHHPGVPGVNYQVVGINGVLVEMHGNGTPRQETTYVGGWRHGQIRAWHESGELALEGQYVHGKRNGPWVTWRPSGQVRTKEEYDRGELAACQEWFADGAVRVHGIPTDSDLMLMTFYYDDGSVSCEGKRTGTSREGEWRYWTPTGELDRTKSGLYRKNKRVGGLVE